MTQPSTSLSQQWIIVTKTKHKHKGQIKNKTIHNKSNQNFMKLEYKEEIIQKFIEAKQYKKNKQLFKKCVEIINQKNQNDLKIVNNQVHIECLGLGNFFTSKKAYIQLLYLERIIMEQVKQYYNHEQAQSNSIHINNNYYNNTHINNKITLNIYDPAFSLQQLEYISKLSSRSQPNFTIFPSKLNIFFMPHCQRNLYQYVYQQYFSLLKQYNKQIKFIVIGNSIQKYVDRLQMIKENVPQVFRQLQGKIKEEEVKDYENAFNDMVLMC